MHIILQNINIIRTRKLCYRKDDRAMRAMQVDREPLRRYGHSKLSKMAAAAIFNLFKSKIGPLDPPSPKTRVSWGHMEPPFWGKGRS